MKLTVPQIMRCCDNADRTKVTEFVNTFNEYSDLFGINTLPRIVHFICQVAWESGYFKYVEENLNYSADGLRKTFPKYFPTATSATQYARQPQKIANRVYANRYGNGNEASGDGWKYRGRGFIQITFKSNYQSYQRSGFCNGDLVSHPEWLAKAPGHTKSAMWYFRMRGCNEIADKDNGDRTVGESVCTQITYKVNGGYNGLAQRKVLYRKLKKEFGL